MSAKSRYAQSIIQYIIKNKLCASNFINETQFDLPNIPIKNMQIKYDYKYEIKNDNVIHLNIKIENKSMDNKKLIVKVGNNEDTSFVLSGLL